MATTLHASHYVLCLSAVPNLIADASQQHLRGHAGLGSGAGTGMGFHLLEYCSGLHMLLWHLM
jgi:hypothetical protein